MSLADYKDSLTESEFMRLVLAAAVERGWDWLHIQTRAGGAVAAHRANGPKGTLRAWPDLTLVRADRMVFCELKRQKDSAVQTLQGRVLEKLSLVSGIEVYVWRPSDMALILEVLE